MHSPATVNLLLLNRKIREMAQYRSRKAKSLRQCEALGSINRARATMAILGER